MGEHREREWQWITESTVKHQGKLTISWNVGTLPILDPLDPNFEKKAYIFRPVLAKIDEITAAGGRIGAQLVTRPPGMLFSLGAGIHPFIFLPAFRKLKKAA